MVEADSKTKDGSLTRRSVRRGRIGTSAQRHNNQSRQKGVTLIKRFQRFFAFFQVGATRL